MVPDMYTKLYSHSPLPSVFTNNGRSEKNWIKLFLSKSLPTSDQFFLTEILSILKQYVVDWYYVAHIFWKQYS